jgi:hypothetical protein
MSTKAGALLWNRQRITLNAGTNTIDTGLTQVSRSDVPPLGATAAAPGPADGTLPASRIQVIPLPDLGPWLTNSISHGEPYLNPATNTVWVTIYVNNGGPVDVNVLFWDPHSFAGPGEAAPYNEPGHTRDCTSNPNAAAILALNTDPAKWGEDMFEHAGFLVYGLSQFIDGGVWVTDSQGWYGAWQTYVATYPTPSPAANAAAKALLEGPFVSGNYTAGYIAFTQLVYNTLLAGEWLGWFWPSILDHMTREAQYWDNAINGVVLTATQLRQEWCQFLADHFGTVAHLLDRTETVAIAQAIEYQQMFMMLKAKAGEPTYDCFYDTLAIQTAADSNTWLDSLQVGSPIPPGVASTMNGGLVQHLKDEGNLFQEIYAQLGCTCP